MRILVTLLAFIAAAAPALHAQAGKPEAPKALDRVHVKTRATPHEGVVSRETFKDVVVGGTTYPAADVTKIEYSDMSQSFRTALGQMERGEWEAALANLQKAEDGDKAAPAGQKARRWWFEPWLLYHRGVCLRELRRPKDAILQLENLIKSHKEARFLPDAYERILECYRLDGNAAGAAAFMKEIDKAPDAIKGLLRKIAQQQQAEILLDSGKLDEAKTAFEVLARDPDLQVKIDATSGILRCLQKKGGDELTRFCENLLRQSPVPAVLLLASNTLADSLRERKQYAAAMGHYVNSVVRYSPGRSSPLAREHERAIFQLGKCYRELAAAAKDDAVREAYMVMAARTFRELEAEYPTGKLKADAVTEALAAEAEADRLEAKRKKP